MEKEIKTIVLLKGLQPITEYQFSMVKFLLANDLKLTKTKEKEYNRIHISKLIRWKARGTTPVKQSKQDKPSTDESTSTTKKALGPESINDKPVLKRKKGITIKTEGSKRMKLFQEQSQHPEASTTSTCTTESCLQIPQMLPPTPSSSSLTKKPRLKAVPKEASKEENFQRGPKEVMVLKATEPFAYAVSEGERKMFHATVATESEFFQKRVWNEFTYYEIQDNTGKMEVVVYGRLTNINCEEGDKLQLICFELALGESERQLRSVIHSFIKKDLFHHVEERNFREAFKRYDTYAKYYRIGHQDQEKQGHNHSMLIHI
ncbi:hypothetical protein HPG69_002735 [Diceros bicornis minor]|uniref:Uncharacterized protein n=1 Tax=Diceros bicornis minor TaxID=77932 RepID=A0A7J7FLX4_DICBM|nr:hypothetical protein HPG69_002735 [Diceros bicornis minor]